MSLFLFFLASVGGNVLHNNYYFCGNKVTKYAIKTGNVTQVPLLSNVMRYLNNEVTVTNVTLCNIIMTSDEVTNLVSDPLSNA